MTATELRQGNIIQWEGVPVTVRTIGDTTLSVKTPKMDWKAEVYERFKPIPITEEWLQKLGFQLDTDYFISLNEIDKNLILVESADGYFYPQIYATAEFSHLENQVIGLRKLKYVHELQNLFFALVREELKTT